MVKIIDSILAERGMTQKEFCEMIGVQSSTMTGWRNGSTPTPRRIAAIEKCLGISFADYEKSEQLEDLRSDLRILLSSAKDLPPSSADDELKKMESHFELRTKCVPNPQTQ